MPQATLTRWRQQWRVGIRSLWTLAASMTSCSSANEGLARVYVPKSIGSLQILPISLYIFQEQILAGYWCDDSDIFVHVVLWLGLFVQYSKLVVVDCRPIMHGLML